MTVTTPKKDDTPSGAREVRRERVSIRAVLDAAVERSRAVFAARQHILVVDVAEEAIWLHADPALLAEAISGLLSHAAETTPPGGRVVVWARGEGTTVSVAVSDTGHGLSTTVLRDVFHIFPPSALTPGEASQRTGAGLAFVRKLIELQGGTVTAASAGLGLGSTFMIALPVFADRAGSDHTDGSGQSALAPKRVLIADDNHDGADSLAMLLTLSGHDTRTVHDGLAVRTMAEQFQPDIIILDIGMPGLNGYEVARDLRSRPAFEATVLVALTAWGAEDHRRRSTEAGFDFHLTKPMDAVSLEVILALNGRPTKS